MPSPLGCDVSPGQVLPWLDGAAALAAQERHAATISQMRPMTAIHMSAPTNVQ